MAIDVVTAEGEILHCDKDHNSDLLWAARGAGPGESLPYLLFVWKLDSQIKGFPAIVTAFYLQTRNSFSSMKASTFIYPISRYKEVMDWTVKVSENYNLPRVTLK